MAPLHEQWSGLKHQVVSRLGNPGLEEHGGVESEHVRGGRGLRSILTQLSHFAAEDPEIQRGGDTSKGHTASKWQSWSETDLPRLPAKLW